MNYFGWDKDNKIDFEKIEEKLGFEIHKDLKEFYLKNDIPKNHYFGIDKKNIKCIFNGKDWFEETEKFSVLFENVGKNPEKEIYANFDQDVIYGSDEKDKDIRYCLGSLINDGEFMGLYFNNKTGEVDFCDFEYGEDLWDDNPRGIISKSLKDFISLLK